MRVLAHNGAPRRGGALRRGVCLSVAFLAAPVFAAGPLQPGAPRASTPEPAAARAAATTPVTGVPLAAVWREQHVNFVYMGRTSRYSCDGLRDKVRALLLDLGARRDVKIAAFGCEGSGRPGVESSAPSLDITFSAPVVPNPTVKPVHDGDLSAVDARFESFTIASDAFRNLSFGDCELVDEFAHQILPRLATRGLRRDINCVPFQASGSRFLVRGEILKPLPQAEQAARGQMR